FVPKIRNEINKDNFFVDGYDSLLAGPTKLYKASLLKDVCFKENLAFGENGKQPTTDEQVIQAVKIAQGTEFVEKMENQYQGKIAQGGTNLSGGQKQRLAIARAVARDPEIYIFDDSFSALDYATDYQLRKELKKHTKDSTNIIVAQRIGTIMNADTIVVLEKGECVGIGTHKSLLKTCKTYQEIAYSQLSKEELNG
ncbi:MAG: ABC transporter ATP-binding protein/permease, partial [Clostridia bacterium]|nr:ABC transporter ATP-binding protein/permease [Clostridia bacterium]